MCLAGDEVEVDEDDDDEEIRGAGVLPGDMLRMALMESSRDATTVVVVRVSFLGLRSGVCAVGRGV